MKFILLIFLANLQNPQESALFHKAFATQAQCEAAQAEMRVKVPKSPEVRMDMYCVQENRLTETSDL